MLKLTDLLTEDFIRVNLNAKSKNELINEMIKIAQKSPCITDIEKVRKAVFDRENNDSTGIGNGLALPHGKTDGVTDNVVSFAITEKPIEFESKDEQPVRLVFFLVGRDPSLFIKLLGRISKLIKEESLRFELLNAKTPGEVFRIIKTAEDALPNLNQ